jgi:hypothetical protein
METKQAELPEITEWRGALDELYSNIDQWSQDRTTWPEGEDLPPTIEKSLIQLDEPKSGPYEVPQLQLLLKKNGRAMWVRPVARWVVGAEGRVELMVDLNRAERYSSEGPFTLVYLKGKGGWHWVDEGVAGKLRPLTGELFRRLVELCLR